MGGGESKGVKCGSTKKSGMMAYRRRGGLLFCFWLPPSRKNQSKKHGSESTEYEFLPTKKAFKGTSYVSIYVVLRASIAFHYLLESAIEAGLLEMNTSGVLL